jgi:2-polyprenyl-6-methoxyphenol hydroxylase-like FAD-dependent oxidoreductase
MMSTIGFTSEIEIMRGELCDILYNAANAFSNVKFILNTSISSLQQTDHNSVTITTSDDKQETYDMLIRSRWLPLQNPRFDTRKHQH